MKKVKITKEQYDRIFNGGLIKESSEPKKEKPSYGANDPMEKETKELISYFYRKSPDLSPFWEDHGVTYDEICKALKDKNLIVRKGDKYMIAKGLGSKEAALEAIEKELRILTKMPEKEVEMEENSNLPFGAENDPNAPWNQNDEEEEYIDNHTDFSLFVYNVDTAIFKRINTNEFYLLDLDEHHIDHEGPSVEEQDINKFLNDNEAELGQYLIPLNIELIDELQQMYTLNSFFRKKLEQIKAIMSGVTETTSAAGGSSGAFTAPMGQPIKRPIQTVAETTVAGAGNFQYDTPGLVGVSRDGKYAKNPAKTKAEKTPQWAGGAFVEQPECSKMNNNKEAQKGGCNSGASSLKTKKASGSVNAPSLAENKIYEEISKQTGKTVEEIKKIIDSKK
jgi:hypothetical protein